MERGIILWDDDIGWCERLRRELAKSEVVIEEVEGWEELRGQLTKYMEYRRTCHGGQGHGIETGREILAVVLSGQRLLEEQPEGWQETFQEICSIGAAPVVCVGEGDGQELQAFLLGASDYIERTKNIRICAARIFACAGKIKRHQGWDGTERAAVLDEGKCQFYCCGTVLDLTKKECLVLSRLLQDQERVVARKDLLLAAWGAESLGEERVLDTVIKQLRHKLSPVSYSIKSKYGVGYAVKRNLSKNA